MRAMGYAYYTLPDGREAGYGVPDVCNREGCDEKIDRGLAYLCGETPGGDEYGCGDYFCERHRFLPVQDGIPDLCEACYAKLPVEDEPE